MATAPATARILTARRRPDRDNWFIAAVMEDWWEAYVESGQLTRDFAIEGSRIRASWAGQCAKRIAYEVYGVEHSNPTTVADAWRFNIGSMIHDHIQRFAIAKFPGTEVEVKVRIGEMGSGHADLVVKRPGEERDFIIAVELKSVGGYKFKQSVGREGPAASAVMQGALNAAAMDPQPDEMMVVYFSLENFSPAEFAKRSYLTSHYNRFAAQWTYPREDYLQIAADELRRLEKIVKLVDDHGPGAVPRIVPDPDLPPHLVTEPLKGNYTITEGRDRGAPGWTWHCGYCPFRAKCADDLVADTPAVTS